MQFDLNDDVFRSRNEWYSYSISIEKRVPRTRRVVINDWKFPDIVHNGLPVTRLVVVVNSNLGVVGSAGQERSNVLSGSGVRQLAFNKVDNKWVPENNINSIDYVSESSNFTFQLRISTRQTGTINAPLSPRMVWGLRVTIV